MLVIQARSGQAVSAGTRKMVAAVDPSMQLWHALLTVALETPCMATGRQEHGAQGSKNEILPSCHALYKLCKSEERVPCMDGTA